MIKRIANYVCVLAILCIAILMSFNVLLERKDSEEVKITMNNKEYTMLETTLGEFMKDGYSLAQFTYSDKVVEVNRYDGSYLEGRTFYYGPFPLRAKGASIASKPSMSTNLWNPEEKSVELKKGVIASLSCEMGLLKESGTIIEIAGMQISSHNKKEILEWMDNNLKGFKKTDGKVSNSFTYRSDLSSYTFSFDEDDFIEYVGVSKEPSHAYQAN